MSSLPVYGYCMLVSASLVALFAMSTDFFVAYVNNILVPCQHDSAWTGTRCMCENTGGVFSGKYCDVCECENFGICGITDKSATSRWGCRCPSHQKWVGTLCDKCYAVEQTEGKCTGECIEDHYDTRCDTVCLADSSSIAAKCLEVRAGGGTCNACNGHGTCTTSGACECDSGWFDSLGGEQCSKNCADLGLSCPEEGGTCMAIGGKMQCVCKPGYFGLNCDEQCPGIDEPCSGHGSCEMAISGALTCTCNPHFIGEDCSIPCPGDNALPFACSGHGQCVPENGEAICECNSPWDGFDCSCAPLFTCSGHGTCNEDATCQCFDDDDPEIHFGGVACERCKKHWYGDSCHLRCDPNGRYVPSDMDGLNIGCNGHGACELLQEENGGEHVICACQSTNPDTFCATCMPNYYPDVNLENMTVSPCSVECNPQTCSYNGICNVLYDGSNNLCICDLWENEAGVTLDTLDPEQYCSTCKQNWFPVDMDSPMRCSEYCASNGELFLDNAIGFPLSAEERSFDLNGDLNAQKICSVIYTDDGDIRYIPDPDCRVCSGSGVCAADGFCVCNTGTTGQYCEIDCGADTDGVVCSGHGRCIRNDLDMWFDPNTKKYRCECQPYDTYTSETRQRLLKRGFQVEPPPSAEHYGRFCEFHCPRYNEEICSGHGSCDTGVAVAPRNTRVGDQIFRAGDPVMCNVDDDCSTIEGAFCHRLSTPWDSLMQNTNSPTSFFANGQDSPGYFTCGTSKNCIDSIYSIEWDDFCVNMLNGWYPNVLNTADCVYNTQAPCREHVEDFFMKEYNGTDTWCQAAEKKLLAPMGTEGICGDNSYANEEEFFNQLVPICYTYDVESFCNAQPDCIYDQTFQYIAATDDECEGRTPENCNGKCRLLGETTCIVSTYCRAKTCSDTMFENNVEKMCLELEAPCRGSTVDWQDFCSKSVGRIRNETNQLNSMETFFSCHMYHNHRYPSKILFEVPGGISIDGILQVYGEDVPVSEFRRSFVESRLLAPDFCKTLTFDNFCGPHLINVLPQWYQNNEIEAGWFKEWLVECDGEPVWLSSGMNEANKVADKFPGECQVHYKSFGSVSKSSWSAETDKKDSILYTGEFWEKSCLNSPTEFTNEQIFTDWSIIPSECKYEPNDLHLRWGQPEWTPDQTIRRMKDSCQKGLDASWIPKPEPLPTLCDMNICEGNDECTLIGSTYSVQCKSESGVECDKRNPCGQNGHCFQTTAALLSHVYYCDITPAEPYLVQVAGVDYSGFITSHQQLYIPDAWNVIPVKGTLNVAGSTITYKRAYETKPGVFQINIPEIVNIDEYIPTISLLDSCDLDINWWRECSGKQLGVSLSTAPVFGLKSPWTGSAKYLESGILSIDTLEWSSSNVFNRLEITVIDGKIRTVCDETEMLWSGDVAVTIPFKTCTVESIGKNALVSSVKVDYEEQILSYKAALSADDREFFFRDPNLLNTDTISDYSDWKFNEEDQVRVNRLSGSTLPPNGTKGISWKLPDSENIRVSGFHKIPTTDKHTSDMQILNEDDTILAHVFVWQNYIWLNDVRTSCKVSAFTWWHWQIQVDHIQSISKVIPGTYRDETVFDQIYNVSFKLVIGEEECYANTQVDITSSIVQLTTHSRIAESFHSLKASEIECEHTCHGHADCMQWSWTQRDSHCYLHSTRCHEDSNCMHGTHLLKSFHPQKPSRFEVFSNSTGISIHWTRIRAEPVLSLSSGSCEEISFSDIDERWKSIFENNYEHFDPDVTMICNSLYTTWTLMPGYHSGVCGSKECDYNANDFEACARHMETAFPEIEQDECKSLQVSNWTAYCNYKKSFEEVGGVVPFYGGFEGNMTELCDTSKEVYEEASLECGDMDVNWFVGCFSRSTVYENYCSNDCLDFIESMLSDNGPDDRGLCEKRKEFLDITTFADGSPSGLDEECTCNMENVIVTDFCMMQKLYHNEHQILVPELYNSECSVRCMDTLQRTMNRSEWRRWCSELSEGTIAGVCSKTVCDCDYDEYAGVSGEICELNCPTGFSRGQELACSGRNGQCFAISPDELVEEEEAQLEAGEIRNTTKFAGPKVPIWYKGPDPSMEGRCQCAIGSGLACSIPCDQCNNGTYGIDMASQYGICDSYNGICRSLPVFMRYNTKYESENYISYNTTAFVGDQGVQKWEFPERFLFESDETVATMARNYILDQRGERSGLGLPNEINLEQRQKIDVAMKVWPTLCQRNTIYDDTYLNNENSVTNKLHEFPEPETRVLKIVQIPSWGKCVPIHVGETWYLCFYDGHFYAYDNNFRSSLVYTNNPGAMYVLETGSNIGSKEGISFAIKDPFTVYAFGGEIDFLNGKSTELFNDVYKISIERHAWDPTDIIFIHVEDIVSFGDIPEKASNVPIYALSGFLYTYDSGYIHRLALSNLEGTAEWIKYDSKSPEDSKGLEMRGNTAGQLYIKYESDKVYTFTPTLDEPWSEGGQQFDLSVKKIDGSSDTRPIECKLVITNHTLELGGSMLLNYSDPVDHVVIYTEEWANFNSIQDNSLAQRFINTIQWRVYDDNFDWEDTNKKERLEVVDILERVHMHQARWSITSMMWVKTEISKILFPNNVGPDGKEYFVAIPIEKTTEPSAAFLDMFRSLGSAFLAQTPITSPNKFAVNIEGDIYSRTLVISANYDGPLDKYEQTIQMDTTMVVVRVEWYPTSLRVTLKEKFGNRRMEWSRVGIFRAWNLVIHLEAWMYTRDPNWKADKTHLDGAFHLYALREPTSTYNMDFQTSKFLQYSASHCSSSSDKQCPGMMPYVGLPCSGRGRCNFACQCVCEVAKSILQSGENVLENVVKEKSPWRGDGCEIACPGYDGYNLDSICSSRGVCQADGTCSCPQGFTGDACQFECPKNIENDICSAHGGCGTKAYQLTSFVFKNDQYMDTLTAKNREQYSSALSTFYDRCFSSNYIKQYGKFGDNVVKQYPSRKIENDAFSNCQDINANLNLDMTQVKNRIYPVDRCVGVITELDSDMEPTFVPVVLKNVETTVMAFKAADAFKCLPTDCYIEVYESDDFTIQGIHTKLISPSFEFDVKYVHGYSTGRSSHIINGYKIDFDFDWTPQHINITLGSSVYGTDVIYSGDINVGRIKMVFEAGRIGTNVDLKITVYPSQLPYSSLKLEESSNIEDIWVAPRYDMKYMPIVEEMTGYFFLIPSEDTGNARLLMDFERAEYDCDQEPGCLGLIAFNSLEEGNVNTEPTLYALYTETRNLKGWPTYEMPDSSYYRYLKKMSFVYEGAASSSSKCAIVEPGLSKYPTVSYTEEYNIPIKNIDIRLAEDDFDDDDDESKAVIVGDGYWSNCWKKIDSVNTKKDCYEYAKDIENVYGFSFSEETEICLVYSGITDNTKIKLDRFNSESRLSLFDPCNGDNTDWITENIN